MISIQSVPRSVLSYPYSYILVAVEADALYEGIKPDKECHMSCCPVSHASSQDYVRRGRMTAVRCPVVPRWEVAAAFLSPVVRRRDTPDLVMVIGFLASIVAGVMVAEVSTNLREVLLRAFSWLKVPTQAFTLC